MLTIIDFSAYNGIDGVGQPLFFHSHWPLMGALVLHWQGTGLVGDLPELDLDLDRTSADSCVKESGVKLIRRANWG